MLDDQAILARTRQGQDAAFDDHQLGGLPIQLLRLVNGYTNLGELIARLGTGRDWHAAAQDLLDRGLVSSAAPGG